jgi:hypothetical protein
MHLYNKKTHTGFAATTALVLLSLGMLAFVTTTFGSAIIYADGVESREMRIQKRLNQYACKESLELMKVKDYFLAGEVSLPEFDCIIDASAM